jgi:CRP-like cAMP-binding protein
MADFEYVDGDILFNKRDVAKNFYVLKSGEIELFDPDSKKNLAILKKGSSFGEQAILAGGVRSVSARAVGKVICLQISAEALKNMLDTSQGIIKPVFEALLLQLYMHNDLRSKGYPFNKND